LQFDSDKNLIKTWESLKECAIGTKFKKPDLCTACKNNKLYKNFYWEKGEEYL
jgi:recombinational DNA repair protein RecR